MEPNAVVCSCAISGPLFSIVPHKLYQHIASVVGQTKNGVAGHLIARNHRYVGFYTSLHNFAVASHFRCKRIEKLQRIAGYLILSGNGIAVGCEREYSCFVETQNIFFLRCHLRPAKRRREQIRIGAHFPRPDKSCTIHRSTRNKKRRKKTAQCRQNNNRTFHS